MATSLLLSMPSDILRIIYQFSYQSDKVELEFEENGCISTAACPLLRVCKTLRYNLIAACQQRALRLVYTVRSPAALIRLCSDVSAGFACRSTRVILMWELGYPLTDNEISGSLDGPMTRPWNEAWRAAFRQIPSQVELVIFDLARMDRLPKMCIGRVINNVSFILWNRTKGLARCRIVGCRTIHRQRLIEGLAINVIPGSDGVRGLAAAPAGPFDVMGPPDGMRERWRREQEAGDKFDSARDETLVPHVIVGLQKVYSFKDLDTKNYGTGDINLTLG